MRITERGLQITFDGALVIVTALLAFVAVKQVKVATRAAKAAEGSNALAQRALTSVQRSFIFETDVEVLGGTGSPPLDLPGIGPWGTRAQAAVIIRFQNSGLTPSSNVVENANVCVRKSDIADDFSYPDLSDINLHHRTFVAPKANFVSFTPLTPDQADAIRAFKTSLFVWGWITYNDIFGKHHRSEYCARYQGVTNAPDNTLIWVADECTPKNPHSCTDKNCPDKWGNKDKIDCDNHPLK